MQDTKSVVLVGFLGVLIGGLLVWAVVPRMGGMSGGMFGGHMGMDMSMNDMMHGMEGKIGDAFDQAFLRAMIVHHEGAVEMAEEVKRVSKRPELLKLADDIIVAQTKEIGMMKQWLNEWYR